MCYSLKDVAYRNLQIALRYSYPPDKIEELKRLYEELKKSMPEMYYENGYNHPELAGLFLDEDGQMTAGKFQWGLIPMWVKDSVSAAKLANHTLNARGETIFEKPSFRNAARYRRCILPVDGFYEYHHTPDGLKIPFYIKPKKDEKMLLAGLWEEWDNEKEGIFRRTCTIVTTKGSPMLSKIHNNPKLKEPRMPVILHPEMAEKWVLPDEEHHGRITSTDVEDLIRPYDDSELEAYTVRKLMGKDGVGNSPLASEPYEYEDLSLN